MKFAQVYIKQTNKRLDHPYDYSVPESLADEITPGVRVAVLFGKWRREVEGFVVSVSDNSKFSGKVRDVLYVIDEKPVLYAPQIALAQSLKETYQCLFYEALSLFVSPVKVRRKTIDRKNGVKRFTAYTGPKKKTEKVEKTDHQTTLKQPDLKTVNPFLMALKTASAHQPVFFRENADTQTDVMAVLKRCAADGKRALLILPEIQGTQQYQRQFHKALGDCGAVFYSGLSAAKKYAVFSGVRDHKISVVMGTRAALFLPFETLDVIVVLQAGSRNYYAASEPHYHMREIAAFYKRYFDLTLLLSDVVAPVDIAVKLRDKTAYALPLPQTQNEKPPVICDMGAELKAGNLSFLSSALNAAIEAALGAHQKVMLFHNRLGYETYVFCRECGHTAHCPHCGRTFKTNGSGKLVCPVCGFYKDMPTRCPTCGSRRYRGMGLGVDQIVTKLQTKYPDKVVLKVTAKTVADQGFRTMAKTFKTADIVVGTSAMLSEFDVQNVRVCAAVLIDADLNQTDYDAAANTYRTYRRFFAVGDMAYLQTYHPDDPVVKALSQMDDEAFYTQEIAYRQMMHYPPFGHLCVYHVFGSDEKALGQSARHLHGLLRAAAERIGGQIYAPVRCYRGENGGTAYRIVMKVNHLKPVQRIMQLLIASGRWEKIPAKISFEIDPVFS